MQKNNELTPPIQYDILWVILGGIILLGVILWNSYIIWSTRKRKIRSLELLPILPPVPVSIEALRQKYLNLINQIEDQYQQKQIDVRQVHLLLSITIRLFVFEVKGIAVHRLTLKEIKQTDIKVLADVIEQYYRPEFVRQQSGDASQSIDLARKMVQQWS